MLRSFGLARSISTVGMRCLSSIPKSQVIIPRLSLQNNCNTGLVAPSVSSILRAKFAGSLVFGESYQIFEPESISEGLEDEKVMQFDSVLRKRRLKMKKHKLRKRRRAQRSLKKRLGKL